MRESRRIRTSFIKVAYNLRYYEWYSWNPNVNYDTLNFHHGAALNGPRYL